MQHKCTNCGSKLLRDIYMLLPIFIILDICKRTFFLTVRLDRKIPMSVRVHRRRVRGLRRVCVADSESRQ